MAKTQPDWKKLENTNWYKEGGDTVLNYMNTGFKGVHQGGYLDCVVYYKDGMFSNYMDADDMEKQARVWLKKVMNSKTLIAREKAWENIEQKQRVLVSKMDKIADWNSLPDEEVAKWYKKLVDIFADFWAGAARMEQLDGCGEKLIGEYVKQKQISIHQGEIDKLISPKKLSYLQELSIDIAHIANSVEKKKLVKSFSSIKTKEQWEAHKKKNPLVGKLVEKVKQKYFWYRNSWGTVELLDELHFVREVKKVLNNPAEKQYVKDLKQYEYYIDRSCREIYKKYNMTKDDIRFFEFMAAMGDWRDERKVFVLIAIHYFIIMLKYFSKKSKIPISLLKEATAEEIINQNFSKENLKRRQKGCFCIYNKKDEGIFHYGQEADKILKIVNGHIAGLDFRGNVACKGKVRGFAKIILNKKDFHKMKQGDILVAIMTRPEYVPLMKMAGAIVTDEGGIASHASIVSRELGVPCIVGTQQATSILKDGMEIEVNANHGLIKIID